MNRIHEPRSDTLPFTQADIEQTVPKRFEQVVERFADQLALASHGQTWTYGRLNQRVNQLAHGIRRRTRPGPGCVAFLTPHAPEMVIAALAGLKAGKAYLCLHPEMPVAGLREIAQDAGPDLVLTTAALMPQAQDAAGECCAIAALDDVGQHEPADNPAPVAGPHDVAIIFYTSGTTGRPKGVMKSHQALLHRVWLAAQYDRVTPADRQSLLTSCSFASSEADMFGALLHGATLCLFDVRRHGLPAFREWIEQTRITLLHPPVLLFRRLLATLDGDNHFPSVRQVALAGDVVLPADVAKWRQHFPPSCRLQHRFSTTETALLAVTCIDPGDAQKTLADSASAFLAAEPVAQKYLEVVDAEGQPLPQGASGELRVRSAYLASGYWRKPAETSQCFQPVSESSERRYRTGDIGRFQSDGRFVFEGRCDSQVKIRGYRVELREVDVALTALSEVAEAATLAERHVDEVRLVGFVALKPGHVFDPAGLRACLREALAEWKIPYRFVAVPSLPTTLTGKVDRRRLQESLRTNAGVCHAAKGGAALEEELVGIWRSTLGLGAVDIDERFLDIGGDSIGALFILSQIEKRYQVRLAPTELLQQGTIRHLAQRINEQRRNLKWTKAGA